MHSSLYYRSAVTVWQGLLAWQEVTIRQALTVWQGPVIWSLIVLAGASDLQANTKFDTLLRTNIQVNEDITYMSDLEHYGKAEHWTRPTDGRGDCEDYAKEKQAQLAEKGIISYLMTVYHGDVHHAVLLVGNYILDNRYPGLRSPMGLPYRFHKIKVNGNWYHVKIKNNKVLLTSRAKAPKGDR